MVLSVACIGHTLGVLSCGAALLALSVPEHSWPLMMEALQQGVSLGQMRVDGAALLGLSAVIWAVLYLGGKQMMGARRGEEKVARVARLSRGTVMTETLIVIPVYLMVMMGSMQLSQTSIAGLMTTLAAFQAGRTASVWVPEATSGRNGVDEALVKDKIRVAAAGVIAPVVPANFLSSCSEASNSTTLQNMIKGLRAAGHLPLGAYANTRATGLRRDLNVAQSFDDMSMLFRGVPKLTFAYCATTVSGWEMVSDPDGGSSSASFIKTTISYKHQASMPFVEVIFGDLETVGQRVGYFSEIKRSYTMPIQMEPNPISPLNGIL